MSRSVALQHSTVAPRSRNRSLRSLVAVLLVAVAALGTTIAVIAIDDEGTTSTSAVANGRSYPTLEDPFQTRSEPTRSYPTLDDPFQSRVEQPSPQQQADAYVRGH